MGMMLSSTALLFKAVRKFKFWDKWYEDHEQQDESVRLMCEVLAWKSGLAYFLHCCVRYFARTELVGHKFTNHVFWVSFVSCVYCMLLGIGASYQKEWSWKAEPICAVFLCFGCVIEGMRIIYVYFDDADDLLSKHT